MKSISAAALALFAAVLVKASPIISEVGDLQKRSIFDFDTYAETSCNNYQENIDNTGGNYLYDLPGYRGSFYLIESDNSCSVVLYTGTNGSGDSISFPAGSVQVGDCFGAENGESFLSVLVDCP